MTAEQLIDELITMGVEPFESEIGGNKQYIGLFRTTSDKVLHISWMTTDHNSMKVSMPVDVTQLVETHDPGYIDSERAPLWAEWLKNMRDTSSEYAKEHGVDHVINPEELICGILEILRKHVRHP